VSPISQRRLNYLFSINKVRINGLVISHLCGFTTIPLPLPSVFCVFLSHQSSYFRWPTQGTVSLPTMLKTMGGSNNQEANPPPPPPLTLEQVLAMQAQMLQTMQQTLVNLHA
jgi:hypothetical protein